MAWRKKGIPLPEASRFDRMTETDLYLLLEASLSSSTHLVDVYRATLPEEKELVLANAQIEIEGALAACKAMRRKLVVVLPNI